MSKLLVVFGATGQQGGSIVENVLADAQLSKEYSIRGTTRDPSKAKAQELAKKGVEVVKADVDDPGSLRKAFEGAHIVFANTVTVYDGHAYEHEVKEGRALADAAVAVSVPFYIYSTLPNAGKISGGKFKNMGHFDGKEEVEQYIRTLPIRSAFIAPGSFMSNFHASMAPHPAGDGTYAFATLVKADAQMPLISTAGDTGKWVASILADFAQYEGKVLCCSTAVYTFQQMADAMSKASGKTVIYRQLPEEVFRGFLPPLMRDHIAEMLLYFQEYGYYGEHTEEKVKWSADQARGKLTTLDDFVSKFITLPETAPSNAMGSIHLPEWEIEYMGIGQLAADILRQCSLIEKECQATRTAPPTLEAGTSTAFWSETSTELTAARTKALGLMDKLFALLQGPHDFLHEFVAPNWDHGALYAVLRSQILQHLRASGGRASLSTLSEQSGIPEDKLVRILALLRCKHIVQEPEDGIFTQTAVSEELVNDEDFRAWVEFQLFETRIASVHLGDALNNQPNDYANGTSGFKQGFGVEMYDWHASHPNKGDRFARAMRGVSKCKFPVAVRKAREIHAYTLTTVALDPADSLIRAWFRRNPPTIRTKVVELGGRYGFASVSLAGEKAELSFEVRCDSQEFLRRGEALIGPECKARIAFTYVPSLFDPVLSDDSNTVSVYMIRNLFWNWADDDAVKLLQVLLPTLRTTPSTCILVTDGVSPSPKEFPPHVEIAYRRRDITTMTMHNVKQRTQAEWLTMFARVDPTLKVSITLTLTADTADAWTGENEF
ncbi:MAG: hypothetical protein Q9181_005659 [Wetmoreana brouardii]